MTRSLITTTLPLVHKTTMRIDDPAGLEITCTCGSVWLTLDGDVRDIVLTAGTSESSFTPLEHRVAILYALEDSLVAVTAGNSQIAYTQRAPVQSRCEGRALLPLMPA